MFRSLNENLLLKIISLAASIVLWAYVSAERFPNTITTRMVRAEVKAVGDPPPDLIVTFRSDSIPVIVTGPKSEVDGLNDNDIKAEFNISSVKLHTTMLKGRPYKMPATAINVQAPDKPSVVVDVAPRERKSMRVTAQLEGDDRAESKYGAPRLSPDTAAVSGRREDLQRVARLSVMVDVTRMSAFADLPIHAYDKDGIEVRGVDIAPATTRVELSLATTAATRTLLVNVSDRGQVAFPYQVTDITVVPSEVTVSGKPDVLVGLSHIATDEIDLNGLMSDFTRDVPLQLPSGVTLKSGRPVVRVTVKVRDTTKVGPTGP